MLKMTNLSTIMGEIGEASAAANEFINNNKTALYTAGAGLVGVAVGAGGATIVNRVRAKKSTTKRKPKRRNTRKRSTTHKKTKVSRPKYARTSGKRKDTSTRRIRMTKTGQPYIILKSGKARFISKKSAQMSRKRKGGRY